MSESTTAAAELSEEARARHGKLSEFVDRINALHEQQEFEEEMALLGVAGEACENLLEDQVFRGFFVHRTCDLLVAWGRLDLAEQLLLNELQKCETTRYERGLAESEAALGRVLLERGRPLEAEGLFRDAIGYLQDHGEKKEIAVSTMFLGQVLVQLGQLEEAETLLNRAEALLAECDFNIAVIQIESLRGQLLAKQGKYNIAIGHMYEAAAQFEEHKQWHLLARHLVHLAEMQRQSKKYEDAVSSYNDAQDYYVRGEDHEGRAKSHMACGELLLQINADLGLTEVQFARARDIYFDIDMPEEAARAEVKLGEIARRRGER
ncbi:hypothetical protein JT358_10760 [Micrococcales bacterium 31B]|nr:hypothetical protein [Micrococcales bacterium 31B]